ncbi:hypothetical protein ILUMI_05799 [Ignelater luminosus]|uniref:Succinate dehydrogenase [ubiquinone] cytochrome b small subunit n=1 Tax=Ignelater luminosus TaxID=2038154 RepID=A0A8K0GIC5_IGNLU|nr:hypothetical protein ILUMI_05799 [Ignelater luminosus]
MALPLMLRSAQKAQGYSCILRCSPVAFKNTNYVSLPQLPNRTSSSLVQKTPILLQSKILTNPVMRCMSEGGDHRMKWTIERLISVGLIGLLPLTIATPNPILDNVTAVAVTLHIHWGIEAMAEDYLRPIVVGNAISKAALIAVYIVSTVTLGGLLYFNYTDIGIGKVIRKFWAVQPC